MLPQYFKNPSVNSNLIMTPLFKPYFVIDRPKLHAVVIPVQPFWSGTFNLKQSEVLTIDFLSKESLIYIVFIMKDPIQNNLVYLVEHLTDIGLVVNHLVQINIISPNEREEILLPTKTTQVSNTELFLLLRRKDWTMVGQNVLEILTITGNSNCVDVINRNVNGL